MNRLLLMASIMVMVGCTSPITDQASIGQCGPEPTPERVQYIVSGAVARMPLKDPESARITAVHVDGPMTWRATPDGTIIGWQISFNLNAKNSFGGYTGPQRFVLILRRDGFARWQAADAWHR